MSAFIECTNRRSNLLERDDFRRWSGRGAARLPLLAEREECNADVEQSQNEDRYRSHCASSQMSTAIADPSCTSAAMVVRSKKESRCMSNQLSRTA